MYTIDYKHDILYWIDPKTGKEIEVVGKQPLTMCRTVMVKPGAGESTKLTATLTSNETPLAGKIITWSATDGKINPLKGVTNPEGEVVITYTAPKYKTDVTITASFAGDDRYQSSSGSSSGIVEVKEVKKPTNWLLICGIIAVFTVIIGVIAVLHKRRVR